MKEGSPRPLRFGLMATGDFAVPSLQRMIEHGLMPEGLITKQPQKQGRGLHRRDHDILRLAKENNIPCAMPESLDIASMNTVFGAPPDLMVVIDFGRILPKDILDWPMLGFINLHSSLLPRWRGADPIRHTLLSGDDVCGVTVQHVVAKVDAGPILSQSSLTVKDEDTYTSLHDRLSSAGADLLLETLQSRSGTGSFAFSLPEGRIQDETRVTFAPKLVDQGLRTLTPDITTRAALGRIRAFASKPGALLDSGSGIAVLKAEAVNHDSVTGLPEYPAGTRFVYARDPCLQCADGAIRLLVLHPAGRGPMPGRAFVNGYALRFINTH